jgi:hypothetical protein
MSNIETSNTLATNAQVQVTEVVQASMCVRNHFEQLAIEREAWESTAYRTSNDQLYALLQKCYATYKAMSGTAEDALNLRKGLNDYINTKGYKFNAGTHTLVKIVKCVFGADRRRVSAYGIVLRTALAKDLAVLDIPDFISSHGGIEEIRLAKTANAMTSKQKATVAAEAVQAENWGVFTSASLSQQLDAGNIGKTVVLVGTWQPDGSVIVRTVVQNDTAVNAALASYYTSVKDTLKQRTEQKQAANDELIKHEVIAIAAKSAVVNA